MKKILISIALLSGLAVSTASAQEAGDENTDLSFVFGAPYSPDDRYTPDPVWNNIDTPAAEAILSTNGSASGDSAAYPEDNSNWGESISGSYGEQDNIDTALWSSDEKPQLPDDVSITEYGNVRDDNMQAAMGTIAYCQDGMCIISKDGFLVRSYDGYTGNHEIRLLKDPVDEKSMEVYIDGVLVDRFSEE